MESLSRAYDVISKSFNINLQKTGFIFGFASLILFSMIIYLFGYQEKIPEMSTAVRIAIVVTILLLLLCCIVGLISLCRNKITYCKGTLGKDKRPSKLSTTRCCHKNKSEHYEFSLNEIGSGNNIEYKRLIDEVRELNENALCYLECMYFLLGISMLAVILAAALYTWVK